MTTKTRKPESPAFACGDCGQEDWSYDERYKRWLCTSCVRAGKPTPTPPKYDKVWDFDGWYLSIQDRFRLASNRLGEQENILNSDEFASIGPAEQVLAVARKKQYELEYNRLALLSEIALQFKHLRDATDEGELYAKIPQFELEIRFRW